MPQTRRRTHSLVRTCAFLLASFAAAIPPAAAQLNQDIDLTQTAGIVPQMQTDYRWGGFRIGPTNVIAQAITMARCGCFLTSMSTAVEALAAGGLPWWAHDQFNPLGGLTPKLSLSPKYLDDFLNVGPNLASFRPAGWGYAPGSGLICGVATWPWALSAAANHPLLGTIGVTFIRWNWDSLSRADVDRGLLQGFPSIVGFRTPNGEGHANLIVGWNNGEQKYLVYDPMWNATNWLGQGPVRLMGDGFPGADANERYSNYQRAITRVLPLQQTFQNNARWLTIFDDPEPIELRLTDPRGRRTGYNPSTGESTQESATAFYDEFTSWADPLGLIPEAPPFRYLAARDPEPGVYGLEVFGTGTGPFTLTLASVHIDQKQDLATITGTITPGETRRYEIAWSGTGAASIAPVPAFGPRAKAGNDASAFINDVVSFDGRGSYQLSGAITAHSWAFGDGASASGAQPSHAYAAPGTYTATLTVTSADGLMASDERTIIVIDPVVLPATETIRVNTTSAGAEALGGASLQPRTTSDGRYVAFQSYATNLVPGDTNGIPDIFVKDLLTGATERVSVGSGEEQAAAGTGSFLPSISADGRFVSFYSDSENLAAGHVAFSISLYVRDRVAGTTEAVVPNQGTGAILSSLSGDGRFVAYTTPQNNIILRDRTLGTNQTVSTLGSDPRVSENGNFVAFVGVGADFYPVISVWNRVSGVTEIVSKKASGDQITGAFVLHPSISADGRYVAFDVDRDVQVVVPVNPLGLPDSFVRDRLLGTTEHISVSSTGEAANRGGSSPSISANGRYVSFYSSSSNLAPNGTVSIQVYRRDRQLGLTERSSVSSNGTAASPHVITGNDFPASVTSEGSVLFYSNATSLVPNDLNGHIDVFMRRLAPGNGGGAATTPLANLGGPYVGWATSAAVPAAIRLDGSASVDPLQRALTAQWDFGDGSPITTAPLVTTHAYAQPGIYQVTLIVAAGGDTSAPAHTEVEVLPAVPAASLSIAACVAPGGALPLDGTAPAANAALLANGWDTSAGPLSPAPVTIVLPWGQLNLPTALPGLTFQGTFLVPGALANGNYLVAATGGANAPFAVPCATPANLPPLAVAGGPMYAAQATVAVTLDGSASSDPEQSPLTYQWDFGDGTFGTGVKPAHTYAAAGSYFVTLIVNDGAQNSAAMVGTRSFAQVDVTAAPTTQPFPFQGFFSPADNPPAFNSRNAGAAMPMKFSLDGNRGLNIFAAGYPMSQSIACTSSTPVNGTHPTSNPGGSSLSYDSGSRTYNYVWKTEKAWGGTCRQFVMKLTDGTFHRANFKFK